MWWKWCHATYWVALTVWIAAIASAGAAAAGVFSTLPNLGLTIDKFEPALGNNTAEHGRLAGGMVMDPIFAATDLVQIAAAGVLLIMLILQFAAFKMRWNSPASLLRILCVATATALLAVHVTALAPRMNGELRQYWRAAELNNQTDMSSHRAVFDADHVVANRLYTARLMALIAAVVASAFALAPSRAVPAGLQKPRLLQTP